MTFGRLCRLFVLKNTASNRFSTEFVPLAHAARPTSILSLYCRMSSPDENDLSSHVDKRRKIDFIESTRDYSTGHSKKERGARGTMEHSKSRNSSGGRKPQPLRRSSIDIRAGQDLDLPKTPATLEIHLNEKEKRICDLLLDVADHLKEEHPDLPPVTLRIAGGWVRDKVNGLGCWKEFTCNVF